MCDICVEAAKPKEEKLYLLIDWEVEEDTYTTGDQEFKAPAVKSILINISKENFLQYFVITKEITQGFIADVERLIIDDARATIEGFEGTTLLKRDDWNVEDITPIFATGYNVRIVFE